MCTVTIPLDWYRFLWYLRAVGFMHTCHLRELGALGILLVVGCLTTLGCNQPDIDLGTAATSNREAGSAHPPAGAPSHVPIDDKLRDRLDHAIAVCRDRHMSPQVNNAWQIVHGVLAFGRDLKVVDNGRTVEALDWILKGGNLKGWVLVPGDHGLKDVEEPGSKSGEGHDDQWLGYLSQCGMSPDEPVMAGGREFKVADLVTQAQWDVREGMEATWTLMALSTYLPLDAKWTARDGSEWSLERLIDMEASQNLHESACGGSHRMYAIAVALNRYLDEGGPLTGGWKKADERVKQTVRLARQFQEADGGFSTNFFERPGTSPEVQLRINTTGHVFEFLTVALPENPPHEPNQDPADADLYIRADWVTRAAVFLCDLLDETADEPLECGGLYHAAHGLVLFRQRLFGDPSAAGSAESTHGGGGHDDAAVQRSAVP